MSATGRPTRVVRWNATLQSPGVGRLSQGRSSLAPDGVFLVEQPLSLDPGDGADAGVPGAVRSVLRTWPRWMTPPVRTRRGTASAWAAEYTGDPPSGVRGRDAGEVAVERTSGARIRWAG